MIISKLNHEFQSESVIIKHKCKKVIAKHKCKNLRMKRLLKSANSKLQKDGSPWAESDEKVTQNQKP
jgi:hypothetical protein